MGYKKGFTGRFSYDHPATCNFPCNFDVTLLLESYGKCNFEAESYNKVTSKVTA